MASRMLVTMNGHNQAGGLYAFLRVFSCAGVTAAMMRGGGVKRASMCAVGGCVSR